MKYWHNSSDTIIHQGQWFWRGKLWLKWLKAFDSGLGCVIVYVPVGYLDVFRDLCFDIFLKNLLMFGTHHVMSSPQTPPHTNQLLLQNCSNHSILHNNLRHTGFSFAETVHSWLFLELPLFTVFSTQLHLKSSSFNQNVYLPVMSHHYRLQFSSNGRTRHRFKLWHLKLDFYIISHRQASWWTGKQVGKMANEEKRRLERISSDLETAMR